MNCRSDCCYFNPRSREGSDRVCFFCSGMNCNFNPRSREGSDTVTILTNRERMDFNPRSREGSDDNITGQDFADFIFQSTLPRGERQISFIIARHRFFISIHAPARGATCRSSKLIFSFSNFNPRSREGSDVGRHYRSSK